MAYAVSMPERSCYEKNSILDSIPARNISRNNYVQYNKISILHCTNFVSIVHLIETKLKKANVTFE